MIAKARHLFVHVVSLSLMGSFIFSGCQPAPAKTVNMGIITLLPAMEPIVTGLKLELENQGYTEGKNINYVYTGPANEVDKLDAQAKNLMDAKVDIIVAVTTPGSQAAQKVVAGTNIPIIRSSPDW